ncbi:MAG: peptidylprolyl isomerase [Nanoarchaeota archaeon]|nr:peptidylprolyl isomerase [Nanoarchaeota archaeon]
MKKTLLLISAILVLGCTQNLMIKAGDNVTLDYVGRLSNGSIFDTSEGGTPLSFTAGNGEVIKGFDDAVIGMSVGEEKIFTIPAADAYGEYNPEFVISYNTSDILEAVQQEIYEGFYVQTMEGYIGQVTSTNENETLVDFNHPLAGKDLTFTIRIIGINT